MLILKNSFIVCLLNTNDVPYALIFNKRPPLKKVTNTVGCIHNTTKCVMHDYACFNFISRGFESSSLGFPWSNVGNMHRRNPVQRQRSASPSHFAVRNFPCMPQICLSFLALCERFFECAHLFDPLNAELNPICHFLTLLGAHFLHVSRIRVKSLTLRLLMSYTYGAPILDVSGSHTTTHHSR